MIAMPLIIFVFAEILLIKNSKHNEQQTPLLHLFFYYCTAISVFSLVRPAEVPPDLVCAICLSVPLNPSALDMCEHIYCQDCARQSLSREPSCPIDRLSCCIDQIKPLRPSSFAYRIWSSVLVQCEECESCAWTGSIADFAEHQKNCSSTSATRRDSNSLTTEKEQEYLARIDNLTWEVSLLNANQRQLESTNRRLVARNEELQAASQSKNHALRMTVDVLQTAILAKDTTGTAADSSDAADASKKCDYDRTSILQLVQQMCQNLESRPVDCSASELFLFVKMIYLDLRNGGKHANNEYFRDDVKLILGVVGASSWFTPPQRAIIKGWCQEQGWGS